MSKAQAGRDRVFEVIKTSAEQPVSSGHLSAVTHIGGPFLSHCLVGLLAEGRIEPVSMRWGDRPILRWRARPAIMEE